MTDNALVVVTPPVARAPHGVQARLGREERAITTKSLDTSKLSAMLLRKRTRRLGKPKVRATVPKR